ncbi:MAG: hypothetical protein Q9191_001511 [Dirinaria sp. TL-2023a]
MDNEVNPAAEPTSAHGSNNAQKDETQRSQEPAPGFSKVATKLFQELATVEKLVEIAIKPSAQPFEYRRSNLDPLAVHAAERTLRTLQLIKETHDEISRGELLLIVEEIVEFRTRELTRLLKLSAQFATCGHIDKVINEIFSLC